MSRRQTIAVLAAVLVGGLCFGPVFGLRNLWLPVASVCLITVLVTEICRHWLAAWRPVLIVVGGLLVVVETVLRATTLAGLPTVASIRALGRGLTGWRLTLESTWPARPDPELVVFVPLLTLIACLLAVELLDRAPPLVALLPGLGVIGASQLYIAASGWSAVLLAVALGLIVVALLLPENLEYRRIAPWPATSVVTVAAIVCGLLVSAVDPVGRAPYSLQKVQSAAAPGVRQTSPLDELAGRLSSRERDDVVFRYKASQPVDRWRQVALDDFDGSNWTTDHPFLRMGSELASGVRVPTTVESASVGLDGLDGPWLPSQLLLATVNGVPDPQVEPLGGSLMAAGRPGDYRLTWRKPSVDAKYLISAGIDGDVMDGLSDLPPVPPEIASLDPLKGRRATVETAIALEKYLRQHYTLAVGDNQPTGYGWPQLKKFLLADRTGGEQGVAKDPGTSAQFAAAYVVLARLNGIPARLVVGFRPPAKAEADGYYVVHNSDAFAWPEVAIDGVGWWPLDPAVNAATGKTAAAGSIDDITSQARAAVPPVNEIQDPEVPPPSDHRADDGGIGLPRISLTTVFAVAAGLLLLWLIGVPLLKSVRALRRRRRAGSAGVVGAWAEARDRLRAYGVPVTAGMTVRDLVDAARDIPETAGGLGRVAQAVDHALWSGAGATPEVTNHAWAGVREVRKALRGRPLVDRFQAALELRTLFSR
ncbi:transglutaminase TgpA family protein [Kribbella sp. WER1]